MDRTQKFGRLIAIANVLGNKIGGENKISGKHLTDMSRKPARTLERIHTELMEHAHKFGADELALLDMFGEIIADLDVSEFTNEPLSRSYLQSYYSQQHILNNIMSAEEAAEMWGYTNPGTVKNMCSEGKVIAIKRERLGL